MTDGPAGGLFAAGVVSLAAGDRQVAAPRDALEDQLVGIWQEVLGVSPIGIDEDFFDLGGHSLLAAAMVGRVAETFARRVPLSLLLEAPTVAGLADGLIRTVRESATPVVTVRADGRRPPFFFLHGDFNGGGLYCARLARGLNAQPFYALEPLGSSGTDAPASIEEMAAHHAAVIRRTRPHGPYLLGGHCNGALEALEIARQFRREGEDVPGVVLIEPSAVDRRVARVALIVRVLTRLAGLDEERRVDLYLRLRDAMQETAFEPDARAGVRAAYWTLRNLQKPAHAPESSEADAPLRPAAPPSMRHDEAVWRRYARAGEAYVPRRYDGSAAIFLGDEVVDTPEDPTSGWRHVGPRFQFHVVRGGHLSCLTTHVGSTSAAIDAYIDQALR